MKDESPPLAGRVAVVTGATGGIGAAICRRLAGAGAAVVVGFRRDESVARSLLSSLAGLAGLAGPRGPSGFSGSSAVSRPADADHAAIQMDVTDSGSVGRFAGQIAARYGRVDLLVNSVGTTRFVPHSDLDALDDEAIDEIFRTNWRGPFATIRALKPLLEKAAAPKPDAPGNAGTALVVNISSVAAVSGIGSNVAYCASKAALNAMTVSLARALAPAIRVVSVSPGVVETEFIQGLDASWRSEQIRRTPLGRLASPEEVADAVLAVATSLRWSTGCIVPVDGGRPLA